MASKKLAARQQFVAEIDGATVVVLQGARFRVAGRVGGRQTPSTLPDDAVRSGPSSRHLGPHRRPRQRELPPACGDLDAGTESGPASRAPLAVLHAAGRCGAIALLPWRSGRVLGVPGAELPASPRDFDSRPSTLGPVPLGRGAKAHPCDGTLRARPWLAAGRKGGCPPPSIRVVVRLGRNPELREERDVVRLIDAIGTSHA